MLCSLPVMAMAGTLEQSGLKARFNGPGNSSDFSASDAVAEFRGPLIYGIVRLAQVSKESTRIDVRLSGLSQGKHGWSINEFGDFTRGAASTGKVFNPPDNSSEEPIGDLGALEALENSEANLSGTKQTLRVADLIGRSIVIYETEDKSDSGIAAAVIGRSAGGSCKKKLCRVAMSESS